MAFRRLTHLIACAAGLAFPAVRAAIAQPVPVTVEYKCPVGLPSLVSVDAPGGKAVLRQDKCTLSGLRIAGEEAKYDVMLAHGIIATDQSTWHAMGYEIGYLANNDMYLAEWVENGVRGGARISLKYTGGTGKAEGITGKLEINCQPPAAGFEICKGTGFYELAKSKGGKSGARGAKAGK